MRQIKPSGSWSKSSGETAASPACVKHPIFETPKGWQELLKSLHCMASLGICVCLRGSSALERLGKCLINSGQNTCFSDGLKLHQHVFAYRNNWISLVLIEMWSRGGGVHNSRLENKPIINFIFHSLQSVKTRRSMVPDCWFESFSVAALCFNTMLRFLGGFFLCGGTFHLSAPRGRQHRSTYGGIKREDCESKASTHLQADTARHLCMHNKHGYILEQPGYRHPKC